VTHTLGHLSFGPLLPTTLGFDDAFKEFDRILTSSKPTNSFPPHNIYKYGENNYVVELATAGFTRNELDIMVEDSHLVIRGTKLDNPDDEIEYIHKGIGTRSFTKKLKLLDTIKVIGAEYEDGILVIRLENIIPDEKRPIKIEIGHPVKANKQLLTE
jgi:molecular chaperone IbpA